MLLQYVVGLIYQTILFIFPVVIVFSSSPHWLYIRDSRMNIQCSLTISRKRQNKNKIPISRNKVIHLVVLPCILFNIVVQSKMLFDKKICKRKRKYGNTMAKLL